MQAPVASVAQFTFELTSGIACGNLERRDWKIGPTVVGRFGQPPLQRAELLTNVANWPLFTKLKNCCVMAGPLVGTDWRRRCTSTVAKKNVLSLITGPPIDPPN